MRLLINCEKAEEYAAILAVDGDDALNENERAAFDGHVLACGECAAFYEQMKRELPPLIDEIKNLPLVELPEGFHEEVMAKIREKAAEQEEDREAKQEVMPQIKPQVKKSPFLMFRRFSAAAAAVVVLGLFAAFVANVPDWFEFDGNNDGANGALPHTRMAGGAEYDYLPPGGMENEQLAPDDRRLYSNVEDEEMPAPAMVSAPPNEGFMPDAFGAELPQAAGEFWNGDIDSDAWLLGGFWVEGAVSYEWTENYTVLFAEAPVRLTALAAVEAEIYYLPDVTREAAERMIRVPEVSRRVVVAPYNPVWGEDGVWLAEGTEFVLEAGVYVVTAGEEEIVIIVE